MFPRKADSSAGPGPKLCIWVLEAEQNWNRKGKALDHVRRLVKCTQNCPPRRQKGGGTEPCTGQGPALALTRLHLGELWGAPGVQAEASQVNSKSLSQWLAGLSQAELAKVYAMMLTYSSGGRGGATILKWRQEGLKPCLLGALAFCIDGFLIGIFY